MNEQSVLEAMFDLTIMEIESINEYRQGGGLERIAETAQRMAKLGTLQTNILMLMAQAETAKPLKFYGDIYKPENEADK